MLPSSDDKKNLIESMKKLSYYISNNKSRQQEIFHAISVDDLTKIVLNLQDDNEYLRRISALLLCELVYNNPELKIKFAEKLNIPLSSGKNRIVIGMHSKSIVKKNLNLLKCLQLIKSDPKNREQDMFCWAIHLDKKSLYVDWFQFKKYSSFTFLDPFTTIFGVTVEITTTESHDTQESQTSDRVPRSSLVETKNQQNKETIIDKRFFNKRPSSSYENKLNARSYEKDNNYSFLKYKQSSPGGGLVSERQSTSKKPGNSIYSISQYARNSRSDRKQMVKQSISFNEQYQPSIHSSRNYSPKTNNLTFRSSILENQQKVGKNNHENFYKRVQEILRK